MATKKQLKQEIDELYIQRDKARQESYYAKEESRKATARLESLKLGIRLGEAIGAGWITCTDASVKSDSSYTEVTSEWDSFSRYTPTQATYSATLTLVGDANSLVNFCKVVMDRE